MNMQGQTVQRKGLEAIIRNNNYWSFTDQLCITFAAMALKFARGPFKGSFFPPVRVSAAPQHMTLSGVI